MQVQGKHIPEIIPDNEILYFELLQGLIESVDELCSLEITKLSKAYNFRVAPSTPQYTNLLLEEILKLNNQFHIHLDLSKSIKSSGGTISFEISTE
jgi:hypothetical protein